MTRFSLALVFLASVTWSIAGEQSSTPARTLSYPLPDQSTSDLTRAAQAIPAQENAGNQATKSLKGTWTMVALEVNGNKSSKETVESYQLTIDDEHFLLKQNDNPPNQWTYRLDPAEKPKTIDLTVVLNGKPAILKGIYELKDDTFTICRGMTAAVERPKEFKTGEGSRTSLAVWTRTKK